MSLSDSCVDALDLLQNKFVEYASWGYSPNSLNHILNAIYSLSEFVVSQDVSPRAPRDKVRELIDGVALARLLDKAHEKQSNDVCNALGGIVSLNKVLELSLEEMIAKLSMKENLLEVIKDPRLMNQLHEIRRIHLAKLAQQQL